MNGDVHLVRGDLVQTHRLNELQPFVHECSAINGDFCAHFPGRVLQRIGPGVILQLVTGLAEEGAAGTGQDQLFDLSVVGTALNALKQSGVLTVHRDNLCAVLLGGAHDQLAGADQCLFVGQSNALFCLDCGQRGAQSYIPHHSGDNGVRLWDGRRLNESLHSGGNADIRVRQSCPDIGRSGRVIADHQLWMELSCLLLQQLHAAVCSDGSHRSSAGGNHIKRLPPNGTSGAQ